MVWRRFWVVMCGVLVVAGSCAARELEIVELTPSVAMVVNERGSNISCVALDEGLVFVDAGLSTEVAADFRHKMETRFSRPAKTLVLTHAHLDHFLGMAAFSDLEVVAAQAARPLFEYQLGLDFKDEQVFAVYSGIFPTLAEDLPAARPRLPDTWFGETKALGSGPRRLEIIHSGGHSAGSAWLYYGVEKVVVAGDLMQSFKHPYFGDPGTDLEAWLGALDRWQELGVAVVCPGHGKAVDQAYVSKVAEYFRTLRATVQTLKEEGLGVRDVVAHPSLPAGYWPQDDPVPRWWNACIARVYGAVSE